VGASDFDGEYAANEGNGRKCSTDC
jgi:hypothetical protein